MAQPGVVPSSWLGITKDWTAKTQLALLEEVNKRGIDPHDTAVVAAIWNEVLEWRRKGRSLSRLRAAVMDAARDMTNDIDRSDGELLHALRVAVMELEHEEKMRRTWGNR